MLQRSDKQFMDTHIIKHQAQRRILPRILRSIVQTANYQLNELGRQAPNTTLPSTLQSQDCCKGWWKSLVALFSQRQNQLSAQRVSTWIAAQGTDLRNSLAMLSRRTFTKQTAQLLVRKGAQRVGLQHVAQWCARLSSRNICSGVFSCLTCSGSVLRCWSRTYN